MSHLPDGWALASLADVAIWGSGGTPSSRDPLAYGGTIPWINTRAPGSRHVTQADEGAPIGLILCAESSREQVELPKMHKDGITVAEYWTEQSPKAELERRLHEALVEARERLARRGVLLQEQVGATNE